MDWQVAAQLRACVRPSERKVVAWCKNIGIFTPPLSLELNESCKAGSLFAQLCSRWPERLEWPFSIVSIRPDDKPCPSPVERACAQEIFHAAQILNVPCDGVWILTPSDCFRLTDLKEK